MAFEAQGQHFRAKISLSLPGSLGVWKKVMGIARKCSNYDLNGNFSIYSKLIQSNKVVGIKIKFMFLPKLKIANRESTQLLVVVSNFLFNLFCL